MDINELMKYKVDRDAPLPSGEPIEKLAMEHNNQSVNALKAACSYNKMIVAATNVALYELRVLH
jgi:hypothetical protein